MRRKGPDRRSTKSCEFRNPLHPYTQAFLSAISPPEPIPGGIRRMMILRGEIPSIINPPSGCYFRTRCPHVFGACAEIYPPWGWWSPSTLWPAICSVENRVESIDEVNPNIQRFKRMESVYKNLEGEGGKVRFGDT